MELPVIKIGNSKGIRLSRTLRERYNIEDKLLLTMEYDHIQLRAKPEPRKGWEKAFKALHIKPVTSQRIDEFFKDSTYQEWSE